MVVVAIAAFGFAYVGDYYHLSRRGMREAAEYGIPGFLYVPVREAAATEDLGRHYELATLYAPLNWVDRAIFETPSPVICIMWRLSG